MKRATILTFSLLHIAYSILFAPVTSGSVQTDPNRELLLQYTKALGFSTNQIVNLQITDGFMKVYINECAFCKSFRNPKVKRDIAHKTLDWVLKYTGKEQGTVEWYNSARIKIMSISGTPAKNEFVANSPPCTLTPGK